MKRIILLIMTIMTILTIPSWANVPNATPLYNQYSCNSVVTKFPYAFQITATSDMQVFINNNAGSITQASNSTFSVDQSNLWVNYPLVGAPCPTGSTITLQPSTPQTQTTTYGNRTPFIATAVGSSLDKLTLISQQLQGQLNRAILAPAGTSAFTFPSAVANNILGWDSAGSGNIVNYVPNTGAFLSKATTSDAQTATDNTKYMTPSTVAIEVQHSGSVSIPVANVSGVATSGANSNITSLTGLSTPLTTGQGGTGASANANAPSGVVVLNGSSQLPASSGALLTLIPLVNQTAQPYIKCSNTQTSGTGGGVGVNAAWTVVPLNTKDSDTASIGSLSSNQLTIPIGTYKVTALVPVFTTSGNGCSLKIRLYNNTDSTVLIEGQSNPGYSAGTSGGDGTAHSNFSLIQGVFTLSGSKAISLQYYAVNLTASASTDLGTPASSGDSEVYATITVEKIS